MTLHYVQKEIDLLTLWYLNNSGHIDRYVIVTGDRYPAFIVLHTASTILHSQLYVRKIDQIESFLIPYYFYLVLAKFIIVILFRKHIYSL